MLSEPLNKNLFLRGFLADLYLRPSCYACPAKCLKSGSDVTIGDFWGIEKVMPEMDDDKGVSVVMMNRDRFNIDIISDRKEIKTYTQYSVQHSCKEPVFRKLIFCDNLVSFVRVRAYSNVLQIRKRVRSIVYKVAAVCGMKYIYKKIRSK